MNWTKYLKILLGVLLTSSLSFGQDLNNLPPSIKWQQIQSKNFRVIFPQGYEIEAQRTTNILESIHEPASKTLGVRPRKMPIILQTHYSVANGFVTVAPYRSEFFTFSPQDYNHLGNDHWLEHLASHEYRHMVQFEKAMTPFNKALYLFMGETVPAAFAGMAAPSWFWEGDAVGIETAMGKTGRGRIPKFTMAFRANTIDKGGFNYYKQHLTSFRDYVPNHYLTGYLMTTDFKNKYGPDVWDKIVHKSFRAPFIPFSFSNSIKKVTGKYLLKSYEGMMDSQREVIQTQLDKFEPSEFDVLNNSTRKTFTEYTHPQVLNDNRIICLKSGWSDIDQLVMLNHNGEETKILELGIHNDPGFLSANDSIVVWTEYEFDTRWRRLSYSVIKKFNFVTGKKTTLTSKTRYASAAVSNAGQIIAIDQSIIGKNKIDLLNTNGHVTKSFTESNNTFYSMPDFVDEKQIVLLKHYDGGKGIVIKDLETGDEEILLFSKEENFGRPVINDGILYYNSAKDGIDNLFAFELKSKKKYQVTKSRFGAFNASIANDQLVYNDYTADGMDVVQTKLDKGEWSEIIRSFNRIGMFYKLMVENENIANILYSPDTIDYEITKYPKTARFFRPVSWGTFYVPENNKAGAYLRSMDHLSTTSIRLGTEYNYSEKIWRHSGLVSYQGWYPILDFKAEFGKRAGNVPYVIDDEIVWQREIWRENEFSAKLRVPFLLTNSNYLRKLDVSLKYEFLNISGYPAPRLDPFFVQPKNGYLHGLESRINFYRNRKKSRLDLAPKWGQSIFLSSTETPFGGDYSGRQFAAQSNLYFPGLFRHHSFKAVLGYLKQDTRGEDVYIFSGPIAFARGYGYPVFDNYSIISANYKLPLIYMDLHIGPIINIQRIYANLFYDQVDGVLYNGNDQQFSSLGVEAHINLNFMRLLSLLDVGLRYSYRRSDGQSHYELLFGKIVF